MLGLGGLQVLGCAAIVAAIAMAAGLAWNEATAVGLTLALSSTAIVLQTLSERGLSGGAVGRNAFAVLLFQDIAVIPILAIMPLLATGAATEAHGGSHDHAAWVDALPGWAQTTVVLGSVVGLVVVGHSVIKPGFRIIARTRVREVFVAAALLLVIAIALVMEQVGLSPALGTFVAGVVLANEFRHEQETDIEPFKGLLLGLFFISIGASIDFTLIAPQPGTIAAGVTGLVVVKLVVVFGLARAFRLGTDNVLLVAVAPARGGEFAFVLFSFADQSGVLPPAVTGTLIVVVVLSMALCPILLQLFMRAIIPSVGTRERVDPEYDEMEGGAEVIIAGFGRVGQIVSRMLAARGVEATMLESDPDQVELLRRFGRKVYYADATRYDLLELEGPKDAKVLVLAIDEHEKALQLVHTCNKHFEHLTIIARTPGRIGAYELLNAGVENVYRETFDTSVRMGQRVLQVLGRRAHEAHRAAQTFIRHDEALVRELAPRRTDADFVALARARLAEIERLLQSVTETLADVDDAAWETQSLQREFAPEHEAERERATVES